MKRWQQAGIVAAVGACCVLGSAPGAWARGVFIWGGYATINTAQSTVTATMTVPALSCPNPDLFLESGVAIIHPPAVYWAYGVLAMACRGPSYSVDFITNGGTTALSLAVAAGNKLQFTLSTATALLVKNLTTGQSASATAPAGAAAQCYVGYFPEFSSTGVQYQIPAFSKITFSGVTIGGQPISSYLTARELTGGDLKRGNTVEIHTGTINIKTEGYAGTFKAN